MPGTLRELTPTGTRINAGHKRQNRAITKLHETLETHATLKVPHPEGQE